MSAQTTPAPVKVFVSYSWGTEGHQAWVVELARRLMADGIDVILDRWDLREGQDANAFMEKMVTDPAIRKVLVISDRLYTEKANSRRGGVGTESQIISQEVYQSVAQQKFIPVVTARDDDGKPYLPTFFAGRIYVDMSSPARAEENYEQLLRCVFDRPLHTRPPLGTPPAHLFIDDGGGLHSLRIMPTDGTPVDDLFVDAF